MAKYMPRNGKQGNKSAVLIMAPPNVPIGMVSTGGNPNDEFKTPAMYPPVPIYRAPPKQTSPVKWARKSKAIASRAKIPIMATTLCQYIFGMTRGSKSSPKIKASLGTSIYAISLGEEIAYIPSVRTFMPRSSLSLRLALVSNG